MRVLSCQSRCSAIAIAACWLFAGPALAQQTITLPGITVQGATLEAKRPAASGQQGAAQSQAAEPSEAEDADIGGVALEKIGSAVTVITGEQLRAQQIRHAGEALRSLPGVHVGGTGGPAGLTQVRIRGAEGNHTMVLIDGIQANDTSSNEFNFANLLSEDIERIEVIRGAQSGIYGSMAIGGVINIITRGGKGPVTASLRSEAGAYGSADIAGRISGGTDKFWLSASAQMRQMQYYNVDRLGTEEDPWRKVTASLKGGFAVFPGLSADFSVRQSTNKVAYDDFGGAPGRSLDANLTAETDLFLGGVNLRWDMFGGALSHVVSANRNTSERRDFGIFGNSLLNNDRDVLSYLGTYRFATPALLSAKHALSGLVEKADEGFFTSFDPIARERGRLALAGEYRGEFLNRLFLTGSLRRDDNDSFADYTTWRTTAALSLHEIGIRPHASMGTGVALPGMFELYGFTPAGFHGNPNLVPERSRSWDAGVEFTLVPRQAFLDVTYFNADLTDKIQGNGIAMFNLPGVSKRDGVEVALRTQLWPALYAGVSYTFLDAKDPSGVEEIRRPRNSGRVDLTYLFDRGRGTFNVAAAYNGTMTDDNFTLVAPVTLHDYWLVSAALSYKVQPGVELFGRVENLLNERYEEVAGFNTLGVAAFAGLKFTLGGPDGIGSSGRK